MELLALVISLVGAAAWIPAIVNWVGIKRRKIRGTIVDHRILENGEVYDSTRDQTEKGTILMLAINFFVSYESFFAKDYDINVRLKNGGDLKGILIDGKITEKSLDGGKGVFICPQEYNFNLHREIIADRDNIRILPMMIKSANFSSVDEIEYIEFIFMNDMVGKKAAKKSVIFSSGDFPKFNHMRFIEDYLRRNAQVKTVRM